MRKFNAIKNAVNFGKGKNTMNKFNEQIQLEETDLYKEGELMIAEVQQYYQDNPNPTEQLDAEDAIDTFIMENSK